MTEDEWLSGTAYAKRIWADHGDPCPPDMPKPTFRTIERGGIVGVAKVVACVTDHDSPWFEGEFGFVLEDILSVPFYRCRGNKYFFEVDYPEDLWEQALAA